MILLGRLTAQDIKTGLHIMGIFCAKVRGMQKKKKKKKKKKIEKPKMHSVTPIT